MGELIGADVQALVALANHDESLTRVKDGRGNVIRSDANLLVISHFVLVDQRSLGCFFTRGPMVLGTLGKKKCSSPHAANAFVSVTGLISRTYDRCLLMLPNSSTIA